MKYLTFLLLLVSGCGVTIHEDPIKVNPIAVAVTHSFDINFNAVTDYCAKSCSNDADPTTCTNACYTNFVSILASAIANAVPSPTPAGN